MIDLNYFKDINNAHSNATRKETYLYDWHRMYDSEFDKSVDYHIGKVNNIEAELLVVDKDKTPKFKYVKSKSDVKLLVGDIVEVYEKTYLITEMDGNTEKLNQGGMEEVNWNLQWIGYDENGKKKIKTSPCILNNATQYNSGEYDGKYITVGTSQFSVMLPSNDDTNNIEKGQRFLIGKGKEPTAYKVSSIDHATFNYTEKGVIRLMIEEEMLNLQTDNVELLIADYWKDRDLKISNLDETVPPATSPIVGINGEIQVDELTLLTGYSLTLRAKFTDDGGNKLDIDNFEWELVSTNIADKYINVQKGKDLIISADEDFDLDLLPYYIKINLIYENKLFDDVLITVKGLFG